VHGSTRASTARRQPSRKLAGRPCRADNRYVETTACICEVCNASVGELRRGRCWGCYARWVDARPVGLGSRCITCNEKRRRFLKSVELFGGWKPMCFNCAGQVLDMNPIPATIAGLKAAVSRERRQIDRRLGKPDTRVFRYERRVGERRAGRDAPAVDDDMIIEVSYDTAAVEDFEDLTQIRQMIVELRDLAG
jgi:hypothetical protein